MRKSVNTTKQYTSYEKDVFCSLSPLFKSYGFGNRQDSLGLISQVILWRSTLHCDSEVENDETSMSPTRTNGKLPFGGATDLRTPADFNAPLGFRYLGICRPATRHKLTIAR